MKTTTDALVEALEAAQNGLRWYQDMYPLAGSGADDEMHEQIDAALARASAAIAQPAGGEMVAEVREDKRTGKMFIATLGDADINPGDKLYTHSPQPAQAVPEGWKLVPVEATPEMLHAAIKLQAACAVAWDDEPHHSEIYLAMLAAAPQPPKREGA